MNGVACDVRLRNAGGEEASCGPFCRKPLIIAKAKGLYMYIQICIYIYAYMYICMRVYEMQAILSEATHHSKG